jgi:hypothetical protein
MPRCGEAACGRWRPALGTRLSGGTQLNGQWYCSPSCLESAVHRGLMGQDEPSAAAGSRGSLRLGAILRHQGAITQEQLTEAVASQRRSGLRLGAELQRLGHVPSHVIVRALAAQAGMSYLTTVDLALVRRAPGGLSANTVRALGLVPFEADSAGRLLHVICTAPPPRAAFRALAAQAGWTAQPYLVDDALWASALAAYPNVDSTSRGVGARLHDVDALTAYVARAATERRAVTMRRAVCPGVLWVRLEDATRIEDLFVPTGEEEPCLVASTPR